MKLVGKYGKEKSERVSPLHRMSVLPHETFLEWEWESEVLMVQPSHPDTWSGHVAQTCL